MRPIALLVLVPLAACGPSFQAIYEGDRHFEHCYALDDDPSARLEHKEGCWREWMQRSTYGQTRDRVEYAARRQRALSRVPELPTDESMMEAAPGQVTPEGAAAPAPTSAFAPPPRLMQEAATAGESARTAPSPTAAPTTAPPPHPVTQRTMTVAHPPSADCQDDCARVWRACGAKSDAKGDAKSETKRVADCERGYKACMRGCFK